MRVGQFFELLALVSNISIIYQVKLFTKKKQSINYKTRINKNYIIETIECFS